jgi:hypothetical protein
MPPCGGAGSNLKAGRRQAAEKNRCVVVALVAVAAAHALSVQNQNNQCQSEGGG